MGQRYVELASTYTLSADGTYTLHVSPLPPNPAILPPGPAQLHIVVNGVPSVGVPVMIGNGKIAKQPTSAAVDLPPTSVPPPVTSTASGAKPTKTSVTGGKTGAASRSTGLSRGCITIAVFAVVASVL